jgi:hypothetical protein
VMDTHLGVSYAAKVNPRESTHSLDIYEVPAGVTPTGIWFPIETASSGSHWRILTP